MNRITMHLTAALLAGMTGCVVAQPVQAVDIKAAWHYHGEGPAGPGARHVARIEQDGYILAYGCGSRGGRSITVDFREQAGIAVTNRSQERVVLAFLFEGGNVPSRPRRLEVAARPASTGSEVVVEEPGANGVLLALLEGGYERLTITVPGLSQRFSLAGAEAVVRRANVACSTSLPAQTPPADRSWDVFGYGGLFEIAMPDDAEEVAATIPFDGRTLRYGGLRAHGGNATYTAIVSDVRRRLAAPDERAQFFAEFVAGTLEGARRNGAMARETSGTDAGRLVRDLQVDYANGTTQFLRIVMIDSRVYLLTATSRPNAYTMARKDRFLASFRPL